MAEDTSIAREEGIPAEKGPAESVVEPDIQVRMVELEDRLKKAEGAQQELRAALGEREAAAVALRELLTNALASYRSAVLAAAPEVPQELVTGESVEEIDISLAKARQMVERIRAQLEAQAASQRVPPGAPARWGPDLTALSPHEKILYALRQAG